MAKVRVEKTEQEKLINEEIKKHGQTLEAVQAKDRELQNAIAQNRQFGEQVAGAIKGLQELLKKMGETKKETGKKNGK